jgi:mutator protein MutT
MTRAAFAVIQRDDQILLVKPLNWVSQYSGHWNFPGGVVEENESLEDGAKREVKEEVDIVCEVKELLATIHNEKYDTSIAIYLAKNISGKINTQAHEISDAKWFTI